MLDRALSATLHPIALARYVWHEIRSTRWYVPWRVVNWMGSLDYWCWADLVTWKMCASDWPRRGIVCAKTDMSLHPYDEGDGKTGGASCWCGQYQCDVRVPRDLQPFLSERAKGVRSLSEQAPGGERP
jgi:hypothetical protein